MALQGGNALDHGGMAAVESDADVGQRQFCMLSRQQKSGVARQNELALAGFGG
jgi:hypothetical protein